MPENDAAPNQREQSPRTPPARRKLKVRRGVVAGSLATFALAWGVIAGSGSMGSSTSTAASRSSASSAKASEATSADQDATQQQPQPSDMTTRQS